MCTSTIMICFLLYLCLSYPAPAPLTIVAAGVYQSAMFCVLGEHLSTEVDTILLI